ncbi:hypothetical protein ABBQ38_010466 [Trebouxia sp. C0009 RCD-2024]
MNQTVTPLLSTAQPPLGTSGSKVAMSAAPGPPQALFRAEQKSLHTCAEAISDTLHHNWTPSAVSSQLKS